MAGVRGRGRVAPVQAPSPPDPESATDCAGLPWDAWSAGTLVRMTARAVRADSASVMLARLEWAYEAGGSAATRHLARRTLCTADGGLRIPAEAFGERWLVPDRVRLMAVMSPRSTVHGVNKWVERYGVGEVRVVFDTDGRLREAFDVGPIPRAFFIRRDGEIQTSCTGCGERWARALPARIRSLIQR